MEYRKKMITILIFVIFGYMTYRYYRTEIYVWFCDNEDNLGACTIAGLLHRDNHDIAQAQKYFQKACDGNYSQGCFYLGSLLDSNSRKEEAINYMKKACELKYTPACSHK